MSEDANKISHSAEAAALGFYYQTFFALLTLLSQDTDNATVAVEQLDDVELKADGKLLLFQLKHSISPTPPSITLKSSQLWRTMHVWVDALPSLTLSESTFHLVSTGAVPDGSPMAALLSWETDRQPLAEKLTEEARAVTQARATASNHGKALPHADRAAGCEAFLALSPIERLNLLRRILIKHGSCTIDEVEAEVASRLKLVAPEQRPAVAARLIEWWDRQVVYSLCAKRERTITRLELQQEVTSIIGDIEHQKLLPDFESATHPDDYQPDGMLTRQIRLVNGRTSDLTKAIREEWRAREQRAKWIKSNPSMAVVIGEYDHVLYEHWQDRHSQIVENCQGLNQDASCTHGLNLLRWTHDDAPSAIRPISEGWQAPYYIRGSYQILSINLSVGWHPEYASLLKDKP